MLDIDNVHIIFNLWANFECIEKRKVGTKDRKFQLNFIGILDCTWEFRFEKLKLAQSNCIFVS